MIESIADHCLSLRVLILAGVLVVDDFLVQKLADGCRKLQYVSFKGCQQVGLFLILHIISYRCYSLMKSESCVVDRRSIVQFNTSLSSSCICCIGHQ